MVHYRDKKKCRNIACYWLAGVLLVIILATVLAASLFQSRILYSALAYMVEAVNL